MEDQLKQTQQIIKTLQSDLDANIASRKDLQSQIDAQKQIRDRFQALNQSSLESINALRKKIADSTDISEIEKISKEINDLEMLRQGFTGQLTNAIDSIIELKKEIDIESAKAKQIRSQLKQNRELLKTLKPTKKTKETPAIQDVAEVSAVSAIQESAQKKTRPKKGKKGPGTSLVPYVSKSTELQERASTDLTTTSGPGTSLVPYVSTSTDLQKRASTELVARRALMKRNEPNNALTTRRNLTRMGGMEVGFHDPTAGIPEAEWEVIQEPALLSGAKKLQSGPDKARMLKAGKKPTPMTDFLGFAQQNPDGSWGLPPNRSALPPGPPPTSPKLLGPGVGGPPLLPPPRVPPKLPPGPPPPKLLGPGAYPSSPINPPFKSFKIPTLGPVSNLFVRQLMRGAQALAKFTDEIEKTSRILSTDWTDAAKILVERVYYSFESGMKAIMGKGTFARPEEIKEAQEQFGQQFGGVMSTKAATEMAGIARRLNVMPQQYIAALRPLSGILGGIDKAQIRLSSTTSKFMEKGLTGKDAMQFMSENSNLIARNGGRFADSLTRAAIEAKKAGYSLQSIEGFGDRIVGDFEGFLEDATAMAAMGMQFDVSSLAEAAVSGDTERLKNELQSQLQAQGLSLENMNRAQRMQLEKTIGMPLEEALKIANAPETAESVTAKLDMDAAKMQSQAANLFRVAVAAFEAAVLIFSGAMGMKLLRGILNTGIGGINTAIGGVNKIIPSFTTLLNRMFHPIVSGMMTLRTMMGNLITRLGVTRPALAIKRGMRAAAGAARGVIGGVTGGISNITGRIAGSGAVRATRGVMGRIGSRIGLTAARAIPGALGLGILGTGLNFAGEKLKEKGYEKTGALADIGGKAASLAGMGALFGPVGAALGALAGTIWGVATNWEAVKKMVSDSITMLVNGFKLAWEGIKWIGDKALWLGGKLVDIGKWLWENNPVIQAFKLLGEGIRSMIDRFKNFKFSDLWSSSSKVDAAQPTQAQANQPGVLSRMGSAVSGFFSRRSEPDAVVATATVTPSTNRSAAQMNADSQTVATNTNRPPTINLPDNATLQQQVTELIRQVAVSNQKLDALATQTITVNMDGQKVGNIIRRSAMAASTGASTARATG